MSKDMKTVLSVIFGILWFSVYSWFPNPEVKDLIRTSMSALLCVFLFLGFGWSRWVLGVLSALGLLAGCLAVFRFISSASMSFPLVIMSLFYAYAAFVLLNPKMLKGHFNRERT